MVSAYNHLFESVSRLLKLDGNKVSEQVRNVKLGDDKPKESKSEETLEGPSKYKKSSKKWR